MLVCPLCRLVLSASEANCPRDGQTGIEARKVDVPAQLASRFAIVEPYAQGGSGELYLADDQQSGRRGVLKIVRLPANVTPAERARLKRELAKQATLAHPVLSVPISTGDADGAPWLFREWYEGISLRVKLVRGGALAVPEALAIAAQIASALDELHRSGLLHRDLKPGHVILKPQPSGIPQARLIDAGIAARIETTSVFEVMGTPEYASPEQAKGKLVSFRSDLYALGCMLFELLTGTVPFSGPANDVLEAHASKPAPVPAVSLPAGVSTLLAQLLAKEPRERPFSAQQVRRALDPFLPEESKREATQTFESLNEKRREPQPGLGTLPPRPHKATVIGMPAQSLPAAPIVAKRPSTKPPPPPKAPRKDSTEELELEGVEELDSKKPLHRVPPKPKKADGTQPLTAMDLEEAEEVLAAKPAPAQTLAGVGAPAPEAPTEAMRRPPIFEAPQTFDPPTTKDAPAAFGRQREPSREVELAQFATTPTAGFAAAPKTEPQTQPGFGNAPPWSSTRISQVGDEIPGLDYDDLAETAAVDRDRKPEPYAAVPQQVIAAPAAPAAYHPPPDDAATGPFAASPPAQRQAYRAPVDDEPVKLPTNRWIAIGAVVAVVGFCAISGVVGAAVGVWALSGDDEGEEIAAAPPIVQPPIVQPPIVQPPIVRQDPLPIPAPVVQPPVVVAPPASEEPPPPEPIAEPVAEPVEPAPEPAEPEPMVRAEPEREEPVRAEPRAEPPRPRERPDPPQEAGGSRLDRFNRAREEALAHFRARRFEQAARAYEQATEINPRHAGSYAGLGASRLALGQHPRAVRAYQRAIALQPRHAGYHAALGQAYAASGDRARARASFQRALSIDPRNAAARSGLQRIGG